MFTWIASYVSIFPQRFTFSSAGRLRALTIWVLQPSVSDSAVLKLSNSSLWNCSLSFYHVVLWGSNPEQGAHNAPILFLSLDTNLQPLSQVRLSASLLSLSANPSGMSRCLQEKSSSTHARAHLLGPLSSLDGNSSLYCLSLVCPSRHCSHFSSCSNCSQQGVWLELPVLHHQEWRSYFHFTGEELENWHKELSLNKFKAEL